MSKPVNPLLLLPKHKDFKIPVDFRDDTLSPYISQLKKHFQSIYTDLYKIPKITFEPYVKKDILLRLRTFQDNLLTSLQAYLNGYPSLAYEKFNHALNIAGVENELMSVQQLRITQNSLFFRSQRHHGDLPKTLKNKTGFLKVRTALDLFHPPFHRRRAVGTNRFSISGYPCLYLSENLHTSYSECFPETASDGSFHAIAFKANRPLYFVDLSEEKIKDNKELFGTFTDLKSSPYSGDINAFIEHLITYQLVIACHTKMHYKPYYPGENYFFKAEYIIPQLLLQWLKSRGIAIDGIRYQSCTAVNRFSGLKSYYNYILPVKESLKEGFCPSLQSLFSATQVYSYYSTKSHLPVKQNLEDVMIALENSSFQNLFV